MASKASGKLKLKLNEMLNSQTNRELAILGLSNLRNTKPPTTLNSK